MLLTNSPTIPDWAAAAASAHGDLFCSGPWFQHFAQTALPAGELALFINVDSNSAQSRTALALKEVRSTLMPFCRVLESMSNYYSCGYGPIRQGTEARATQKALCAALATEGRRFDGITLGPLDRNSAFAVECETQLRAARFHTYWTLAFRNWYATTENLSYADYLKRVPSSFPATSEKRRQAFLRKGTGSIEITTSELGLEAALLAYTEIYDTSWKVPEPFPLFMSGLIGLAARNGSLRLGTLRVNGESAATQLWFVADGRALIYKVAYAERFNKLSVGSILTAALLDHVISVDRVREVDFLSGDDAYKSKWMFTRRDRHTLLAFNPRRWRGLVASAREAVSQNRQSRAGIKSGAEQPPSNANGPIV